MPILKKAISDGLATYVAERNAAAPSDVHQLALDARDLVEAVATAGDVEYYGQRFQIRRGGKVLFDGQPVVAPFSQVALPVTKTATDAKGVSTQWVDPKVALVQQPLVAVLEATSDAAELGALVKGLSSAIGVEL
jgi:hypothetical protein